MPVKQVFDTKDDAPEWLRPLLLESEGKFVFEAETTVEVAGLKKALDAERKAKADFEKSLKGYEGIDPEEARRLKAEAEEVSAAKLRSKGDWETREKQLKDQLAADLAKRQQQFDAELTKRAERESKLQSALDRALIEANATAAIASKKGVPQLLLPHILRQVKVVEENGEFQPRVIGADGNPRIADVKGNPFTIANLVEEMYNDPVFGRAFEANGAAGSGAPNNTNSSGRGVTLTREQAKDPATYRAAKEQAAKQNAQFQILDN